MQNISVVLGYGIFLPPNPEYQKYLESALDICFQKKSDQIIICGGRSSKDYPDLSEAATIKNLFIQLHPEIESKIIKEEKSLSTPQNLQFAFDLIKPLLEPSNTITVICDSIRVPKVFYLSLQLLNPELSEKECLKKLFDNYLNQDPNLIRDVIFSDQSMSVIGIPLSQSADIVSYQIASSMLEMHSIDYPDLHQLFIDWRQKKWGIK